MAIIKSIESDVSFSFEKQDIFLNIGSDKIIMQLAIFQNF